MLKNKKGAALLQVLLITVVLAGIAAMLLRASLSRTTTARQTRRTVSSQLLINACMAEVNALWSHKKPEFFASDLDQCIFYCNPATTGTCAKPVKEYTCASQQPEDDGLTYQVTATMSDDNGKCLVEYNVTARKGGSIVDVEF